MADARTLQGQLDECKERCALLDDKLGEIGLLISSVSHGIKGLLNGLEGGMYLVGSGLNNNNRERIRQGWEMAQRNVGRVRSMILDILYYARDREMEREDTDAAALLREVCDSISGEAREPSIDLICTIETDQTRFLADPRAMRSLLANLIEHSLDSCRADTKRQHHRVLARLSKKGGNMIFCVTEDGIGLEKEDCATLFSRSTISRDEGGPGPRLFVANKIAQAHGGHIQASALSGLGTEFRVEIPN